MSSPLYPPGRLLFHLTLVQQLHAQTIQNGYYFTNRNTMDSVNITGEVTGLITVFKNNILPSIKNITSQELVYRSIIVTTLWPIEGPIAEEILETSQGDQAFESLPSYCAAVLTLRSGLGGKSNRGRSYYSGISAEHCSASRLDGGTLTGLQTIGNQLLNLFGPTFLFSQLQYVIYSRKRHDLPETNFPEDWTSTVKQTIARSVLGTQRHRKIGIGN